MSSSKRIAIVAMLILGIPISAEAQNSSLLHAPSPGTVVRATQAQTPVAAPARSVSQTPLPAPTDVPLPNPQSAAPRSSRPSAAQPPFPGYASQANYDDRPPVMLNGASWTHQPPLPMRSFRQNDVVTIRVDEITRMMAEGSAEQRKRTLYEAVLTDWIRLKDFRLQPDPQGNGDPTVTAESNSNYRAESTVESRESMTFNIAATVVDIRPNGMLVLEARKAIRVNDNLWETSLSGICRAQDIAPDNVVLSKDLIDLEIRKEDRGHLRDGYSRGWLTRFLDRYGPF